MTLRLEQLLAAEGQELPGEPGRLFAGLDESTGGLRRAARLASARRSRSIRIANDGGEQIIEVVGHAARQSADRFHLLRVPHISSLSCNFFSAAIRSNISLTSEVC